MEKKIADFKEYSQRTGSDGQLEFYFCGREKCKPGHTFGPAVRTHFLFHFILSGSGFYERAGHRYEIRQGQGFLILPDESTRYGANPADPWEYCWIGFGGREAENILRECGLGDGNLIYEDRSGGLLAQEMKRLTDFTDPADLNRYMLLGRLYLCFSCMIPGRSRGAMTAQEYVKRALDFIHNNFGYEIGVEEIARNVGIDRTYLYRIFRLQTGQSPKEYLTSFRLHKAAGMLAQTDLSVTEIALSCGFNEASLFGRHFRRRYGASPVQYRRESRSHRAAPSADHSVCHSSPDV
jgi:AraC-like DNA-binding protein